MATTSTYNIQVNTNQAQAALQQLQGKLNGTNDVFSKLKGAVAGIAFGAAIRNALAFADSVSDLSDATGIAVENILGFQKAIQAAGGNAEGADKAILRLVNNIGEAAAGSGSAQDAFARVGISLKDLATLSETDLLRKTVAGLAAIKDPAEQAVLKTALFGKEARGISAAKLDEALDAATASSGKYANSIKTAADLQDNLDKALGKVKLTLLQLIEPVAKFINAMDQEKLMSSIETITKLAVALGGLWAALKVLEGIKVVVIALLELAAAAGLVAANFTPIGRLVTIIAAGMAAIGYGVKAAFDIDLVHEFAKVLGLVEEKSKNIKPIPAGNSTAGAGRGGNEQLTKQQQDRGASLAAESAKLREVTDAFAKQRIAIGQASEQFAKYNSNLIDQINIDNMLIGKSKEYQEVIKAQEDLYKRSADEIDKLRDAKSKLNAEEQRAGLGAAYDAQIKKIQDLAAAEQSRIKSAIENTQRLQALEQVRLFGIQNEIDKSNQLQSIMDDTAKMTMNELEKKYYDIDAAAKASAKSAIEAEESRQGRKLNSAEQKAYYDAAVKGTEELKKAQAGAYQNSRSFSTGWKQAFNEYVDNATNAANRAKNIFQKATQGMEDLIVNFVKTGKFEWKNFVAMMLEELLRAQIQQIFAGLMGGMQDSMSGMTGGGGGGGGGSSGGGGGGIMDAISGLFGGGSPGSSPNKPMYVIDVSGGMGAGMMGPMQQQGGGGLGGIWDSITGLFGGGPEQVGGPGTPESSSGGFFDTLTTGLGDFFSGFTGPQQLGGPEDSGGLLDSIGSLFDGWFAGGGQIGAGKFGVVGENGPELVGGPASVTPMSGGSNVTFNINAVDAQSFKSMIAADPGFLYGVAMQGAKGIPMRG
jgi:lambda family phage tail tape measure protein